MIRPSTDVLIRPEISSDIPSVFSVHAGAFKTEVEAQLVDTIRAAGDAVLSLVAIADGECVGHILFSPVETKSGINIAGLAPMAVKPAFQRKGIGSLLITDSLPLLREQSYAGVIVLGHPRYYPRFGFRPASQFDITSTYDVPDEVFMALELVAGGLDPVSGIARYHPAFDLI